MSTVKTAISLDEQLLEKIDSVAQEIGIPRSRLFVIAMEAYLKQRQNNQMMDAINRAYHEHPSTEKELTQLKEIQALYVSNLEDEEW